MTYGNNMDEFQAKLERSNVFSPEEGYWKILSAENDL